MAQTTFSNGRGIAYKGSGGKSIIFPWKLYGDAAILKPIAWRERERAATTCAIFVNTYTTSPEHLCEDREFDVGMTAQVFRDARGLPGIEARQMARGYLNNFLAARKREAVLRLERYILKAASESQPVRENPAVRGTDDRSEPVRMGRQRQPADSL